MGEEDWKIESRYVTSKRNGKLPSAGPGALQVRIFGADRRHPEQRDPLASVQNSSQSHESHWDQPRTALVPVC